MYVDVFVWLYKKWALSLSSKCQNEECVHDGSDMTIAVVQITNAIYRLSIVCHFEVLLIQLEIPFMTTARKFEKKNRIFLLKTTFVDQCFNEDILNQCQYRMYGKNHWKAFPFICCLDCFATDGVSVSKHIVLAADYAIKNWMTIGFHTMIAAFFV